MPFSSRFNKNNNNNNINSNNNYNNNDNNNNNNNNNNKDGAPSHCTDMVLGYLYEKFGGRVITRVNLRSKFNADWEITVGYDEEDQPIVVRTPYLEWSPYSPELSPCDFWLWVSGLKYFWFKKFYVQKNFKKISKKISKKFQVKI